MEADCDNHMHNKGLDARLLSFELKFTDSREHSERIQSFCGKNYGILGKALSEYLLKAEPEKIAGIYEECKRELWVVFYLQSNKIAFEYQSIVMCVCPRLCKGIAFIL